MTSRDRTSTYKGTTVTVRWKEIKTTSSSSGVFISSYVLTSMNGTQTEWRQFHTPFHTYDTAAAYALAEAYRFIDLQNRSARSTTP